LRSASWQVFKDAVTPLTTPPARLPPEGAGLLAGGLSRRRVFQVAGVGGVGLLAGTWLYRTFWRLGSAAPGRACLTLSELATAAAIGEAFFPGPPDVPYSAAEVRLDEFVDGFVGGQYEDNQRLFKVLLRALEQWPLLQKGRHFSRLTVSERQAVLNEFRTSRWLVRRAAYTSLRYMFSLGYFEDMRVRKAAELGFGCDLSSRFALQEVDP
jgi:hypothetical protein